MGEISREITVKAVMDNLDSVTGLARTALSAAGCPKKVCAQIAVSLEEAYVNVVNYAYTPLTGDCHVALRIVSGEANSVTLTICDSGRRFDPLAKAEPDVTLSAQERQIGGLGIYMIRQIMDSVSYRYEDGENILTMTKSW